MMQRKHLNVDGGIAVAEQCKVRKRGSSSSSSSSLLRNYRLKRAILVGKKAGSSTPVPMWKMNSSRSSSLRNDKAAKGGELGKEIVVSARKLAATLWEINGVSSAKSKNNLELQGAKRDEISRLSKVGSMPLHCSDPSFSPLSKKMDQYYCHRRRASNGSQKLVTSDCSLVGGYVEVDQSQEVSHGRTALGNRVRHRLKDLQGALSTSKELLKVLNNMWQLEEEATQLSLVSALKMEVNRACTQVNKVIHEHRSNEQELDFLLQQFEKGKMKEKERMSSVAGELEIEKKLKRQSERLNKKLGRELADTKASLLKATKELEREKKAREILEQVCDELARGIGEDRAIVAESAKVRKELEKEREMLHLADVLREERVQMKLLEAKYQFEEKNAVVDELKNELEAYLRRKVDCEEQGNGSPNYERIRELEKYLRETLPVPNQYQDQGKKDGRIDDDQEDDEEDSADSDLHSIELEVDENGKSFKWNATSKLAVDDGRIKGSEKRERKSICMERQTSDGIEWEFSPSRDTAVSVGSKIFEFSSKDWKKESQDEIERYNMIKDLRDNIVSGSKIASSSSPKPIWEQHNLASHDLSKVVREAFGVLQEAA